MIILLLLIWVHEEICIVLYCIVDFGFVLGLLLDLK